MFLLILIYQIVTLQAAKNMKLYKFKRFTELNVFLFCLSLSTLGNFFL